MPQGVCEWWCLPVLSWKKFVASPSMHECALHLHKEGDGSINVLQSKLDQLLVHAKAIQEMRHFANILVYLWRQGTDSLLISYITLWSSPPPRPSPLQLSLLCDPKLLCRKVKVQLIVSSPKNAFSPLASKFKSFCQKKGLV